MNFPGLYDWIIRNGNIVDGTGNPSYHADIAIQNGFIVEIGNLGLAHGKQEVDAHGHIVCPGFIDVHDHADLWLLENPQAEPKLRQGVTTDILGQDGLSSVPGSDKTQSIVDDLWMGINGKRPVDFSCYTVADYLSRLDRQTSINIAYLVPHLTARIEVMGLDQRPANSRETLEMIRIVEKAMSDGAVGISTGLTYWPAIYASTEELIGVCSPLSEWGGIYVTHLRDYGDNIVKAIEEATSIGKYANVPVHISHLNHRANVVLPCIEKAKSSGINITFDSYPYLLGNTLLSQYLPSWIFKNSIAETLQYILEKNFRNRIHEALDNRLDIFELTYLSNAKNSMYEKYEGRSIPEIAAGTNRNLIDVVIDILIETRLSCTVLVFHTYRTEQDIRQIMYHPLQMFCTDAIYYGGHPHPRVYGTYPKVLSEYVNNPSKLTIEGAIRKMTSIPAQRFSIKDRGKIKRDMVADIVVFDSENISSTASFESPIQYPKGIEFVWVNGVLVLDLNGPTGKTPGRALKPLLSK